MDQICLMVPILVGKTAEAWDFMRELEETTSSIATSPSGGSASPSDPWSLASERLCQVFTQPG
jgi:hypothetical protein